MNKTQLGLTVLECEFTCGRRIEQVTGEREEAVDIEEEGVEMETAQVFASYEYIGRFQLLLDGVAVVLVDEIHGA